MRQDTLQFVQRVVADHQLTFAFMSVPDLHGRAQPLCEALFQTADVRISFGLLGGLRFVAQPLPDQSLGLTNRQTACDNVSRSFQLPQDIDQSAAKAKYDNGVLTLTLPKKQASNAQRLHIE